HLFLLSARPSPLSVRPSPSAVLPASGSPPPSHRSYTALCSGPRSSVLLKTYPSPSPCCSRLCKDPGTGSQTTDTDPAGIRSGPDHPYQGTSGAVGHQKQLHGKLVVHSSALHALLRPAAAPPRRLQTTQA